MSSLAPTLDPASGAVGKPSTPHAETPRVVWALAWPVILALLSESLVQLVDMLIVARLGATAVAAVGVGGQILNGVAVTMTAVGTGVLALVARNVGAGTRSEAQIVLGQSILAAVGLAAAAILPVIAFAPALVRAFGVAPEVVGEGVGYVRFVMLSVPASSVVFAAGAALRGAGDTRTPLAIGVLVNAINVVLNYVLVYGKLGFPALGVRGSAIATAIAFSSGAAVMLARLASGRAALRLLRENLSPRVPEIRRVLRIGAPAAAEQLLMQVGFFLYLLIAARYGTDAVAAYFIGVRILALSFLPGFGFAAAAGALVGQHIGARSPRRAESAGWLATWMSVTLMSIAGVIIFEVAEPIARLFVDSPAVVGPTVSFIHMLAIAQPFMAMDFTLGGALRGAGDTRFPLLTVLIAFYGCRLGIAVLVASVLHLSLPWLWSALIGDYIVRATLKVWRFRSGSWRNISI